MLPSPFAGLREFMSYLAPGVFFLAQAVLPAAFVAWWIFPDQVRGLPSPATWGAALVTFAALLVLTLAYLIGMSLRLPPVDLIDRHSIAFQLWTRLAPGLTTVPAPRDGSWWERRGSRWLIRLTGGVPSLSARIDMNADLQKRIDALSGSAPGASAAASPPIRTLRDVQRHIRQAACARLGRRGISPKKLRKKRRGLEAGLWAADIFPYPLWLAYRNRVCAEGAAREDFERYVWPLLLESMHGEVSAELPAKGPFNRAKLYIQAHSPALAGEAHNRESMVRMTGGIYQTLRWAVPLSLIVAILAAIPMLVPCLRGNWHTAWDFAFAVLLLTGLFFLNRFFRQRIVEHFHTLRIAESQEVLDSYLILHQRRDGGSADGETKLILP